MSLLVLGLALFVGVHLVPAVPAARAAVVARLGENGYKGIFSLISIIGLAVAVTGFGQADGGQVWFAPSWGVPVAKHAMPLAFILMVAAYAPTHMRRLLRHPMAIAVALWAGLHLLANGDARELVLFGVLGVYAVFSAVSAQRRGKVMGGKSASIKTDLVAVAVGAGAYGAVLFSHEYLFGVPLL